MRCPTRNDCSVLHSPVIYQIQWHVQTDLSWQCTFTIIWYVWDKTIYYTVLGRQMQIWSHIFACPTLMILGNLPVERAKDAVCFLQRCGVSLVSSYAVCFLQRGGVSLASSAIIYDIVKVKVTRRPVWAVDPLTRGPVDPVCFLQWGGMSVASSAIIYNIVKVTLWPVDPSTRRPFRKRTPQ